MLSVRIVRKFEHKEPIHPSRLWSPNLNLKLWDVMFNEEVLHSSSSFKCVWLCAFSGFNPVDCDREMILWYQITTILTPITGVLGGSRGNFFQSLRWNLMSWISNALMHVLRLFKTTIRNCQPSKPSQQIKSTRRLDKRLKFEIKIEINFVFVLEQLKYPKRTSACFCWTESVRCVKNENWSYETQWITNRY